MNFAGDSTEIQNSALESQPLHSLASTALKSVLLLRPPWRKWLPGPKFQAMGTEDVTALTGEEAAGSCSGTELLYGSLFVPWSSRAELPEEWSGTSALSWITAKGVAWELLVSAHAGLQWPISWDRSLQDGEYIYSASLSKRCFLIPAVLQHRWRGSRIITLSVTHQVTCHEFFDYFYNSTATVFFPIIVSPDYFFR